VEAWVVAAGFVGLVVLLVIASMGAARGSRLARQVRTAVGAAPSANALGAVVALRAQNADLENQLAADQPRPRPADRCAGPGADVGRSGRGRELRSAQVPAQDLGQVATESTERLRPFGDRQGVSLRVDVACRLPPVRGDAQRLGQVYINLLHNAVKFSPDGGDVVVTVQAIDGDVIGSVADHGVGMPKAAQGRIFERFYKADRARVRGETGGTGLGLSIARHIIDQHRGTIGVESVEGEGSTFRFSVPIA
jgi:hypothetical protein